MLNPDKKRRTRSRNRIISTRKNLSATGNERGSRSYLFGGGSQGGGDTGVVGMKSWILLLAALAALVSIAVLPSSNAAQAQETSRRFPTDQVLRAEATGSGIDADMERAQGRIRHRLPDSANLAGRQKIRRSHQCDGHQFYQYHIHRREDRARPVLYLYYVRAIFRDGTLGSWSSGVKCEGIVLTAGNSGSPTPPVYIWRVVQGELPQGLFLNERTGEFYGTPGEIGHYRVIVERQRVDDGSGGQPVSGDRGQ